MTPFKSSAKLASSVSSEMLRCVVLSAARSHHVPRPLLVPGFRFNSSQSSEERKAHNKAKNELQKDWVAPILTFEQVKRKSQQPSEVRPFFTPVTQCSSHIPFRMR